MKQNLLIIAILFVGTSSLKIHKINHMIEAHKIGH